MFCKGLKLKDKENNIYTVIKCDDIHNLYMSCIDVDGSKGKALWCADKNCNEYDGELIPINLNSIRKKKLKRLSLLKDKNNE
jgi:hypothetical protein